MGTKIIARGKNAQFGDIIWSGGGGGGAPNYGFTSDPTIAMDFTSNYFVKDGIEQSAYTDVATLTQTGTPNAVEETYIDADGLRQGVSVGTLRTDHHVWDSATADFVKAGAMIEGRAIDNFFLYSNDFTQADWVKIGTTTINAGAADGPGGAGALSGFRISDGDGTQQTGPRGVFQSIPTARTTNSGFTYISVDAKPGSKDWIYLRVDPNSVTQCNQWFNVSTGAVGSRQTAPGFSHSFAYTEKLGNGSYRCHLLVSHGSISSANRLVIGVSDADNSQAITPASAADDLVYIGAAQHAVNLGSYSGSSYVETTTASRKRGFNTLTIPAANIAAMPDGITVAWQGWVSANALSSFVDYPFIRWDDGGNEQIDHNYAASPGSTGIQVEIAAADGGAVLVDTDSAIHLNNQPHYRVTVVSTHGPTSFTVAVDNINNGTSTSPDSVPAVTGSDLRIGGDINTPNVFLERLVVWGDVGTGAEIDLIMAGMGVTPG